MLSAGQGLPMLPHTGTHHSAGTPGSLLFNTLLILISLPQGTAWPYDYRYLYNHCPGPEWNVMCRGCCEYDVIRCKCPFQGTPVGYAVPCCRNAINECDPCIIHPGCSIFENCKRCNNGTWGPRDDFFVKGKYCAECRPGWSGGDCLKCGGVIRKHQGHIVMESYPTNARCEWTVQVDPRFTINFRFMMLSLEFDHSCRYDYVEVRDGDSINSRVIGRFCGNDRPAPIQSSGNSLHVLFVSDGYKNFDGFFAIFQESSACSSSPCLHDGTCILDTSHSYHCGCLAGYTGQRCENVVGCRRPPVPVHGTTEGVFHNSGAQVIFSCDPGFELRGVRTAVCLRDGTWSTPAPQCVPMVKFCAIPAKPIHGDHFKVYGPNDVILALQYLCYQPYKLSGTHQRTCLPNNTWSGTPPTCGKVNNTLAESGKDTEKNKDTVAEKDKDTDTDTHKDIEKPKDKEIDNTTGIKEDVAGKEPDTGLRNTTVDIRDGKEKNIDITRVNIPEGSKDKTSDKEKETGLEKPTGGSKDKVDSKETDDMLNTVEGDRENDLGKTTEDTDGSPDTGGDTDVLQEIGKTTEIPEIVVVVEDKGQEKKEEKKEQPGDTSSGPNIVDPNDLKPRGDTFAIDYTEIKPRGDTFAIDYTVTDVFGTNDIEQGLNTTVSKDVVKSIIPTRSNNTQFTPYSSGGQETKMPVGKPRKDIGSTKDMGSTQDSRGAKDTAASTSKPEEENAGKDSEKPTKESEDEKRENQIINEKSCPPLPQLYHGYQQVVPGMVPETVEFFCNHSYALSGDARRSCQPGSSWGGVQPLCVRACREPKVSELVRQRVLPPQAPFRYTPVHKLYSSSGFRRLFQSAGPTKGPPVLSQLPQGFHHLYTHVTYECASPFYHHSGSARRTCLKTGKWSGRHVSCSPVCGKHHTFDPQSPAESHWPWLAAIYRRSTNIAGTKLDKKASLDKTLNMGPGAVPEAGAGSQGQDDASGWQLVCSGALVNQRSVVVAAHCVTELGKMYPLDAAKVKVVMGKHYRSDLRETKGLQHLRVASISVHHNYDPLVLDSDLAVIKLLDKARIGEKVLPLCLPDTQGEEAISRKGLVMGWAPLPDPRIGEEERARVGVQHLADVVPCEQQYARNGVPVSVTDNMLCGRQRPDYGPSNICPADTGGILILPAQTGSTQDPSLASPGGWDMSKGEWRLLGLVSFGYDQGECDPDLFTVYTHVANFKDWIESHMK
ncbi:inactive serine protease PAMR1 [Oncorhynchus kisutch]|uniref:Inactive serine protease PAMR1 n=1 Tax=Oncorhynchus kisutch TaxID=8019 RepID=A0A8C7CDR0_ONCKI|nr:inactive serine protease PAMR1 [Oncorhynchus kisutch]